jgi:two-component system, LuxR family, sensor kinase FixL
LKGARIKRRMQSRRKAKTGSRRSRSHLEARVKARTAELRAANKKLEREIQRRKGLEGEILEISDREQQRIGQELHDELCQHLTAVAFMTRAVALRLKNHRVIEFEDLDKISELVNQGATDARNIARGLHTAEVDAARLLPAIRDLVSREIWKTPCRLEVKTKLDLHDDAVASHLYRLLREAVINAHKHAQAKEIVVGISRSNGEIVFSVTDDGIGIPAGKNNRHGLGFYIMNYRARTIGARLEVKRRQRRGTRVALYLPQSK